MTSPQLSDPGATRDPDRPSRLLRAEHDALVPILQRTPEAHFGNPTACSGWSVRDVLAHCGAALSRAMTGELHAFTPELNEVDVAERRPWPLRDVLSELAAGYLGAGEPIAAAGGRLDGIALGEWIHGGDVREALGEPLAYASDGYDDACALLVERTRRRGTPPVEVHLGDRSLVLGAATPTRPAATLRTDRSTFMRLVSGRPVSAADFVLTGATPDELLVFLSVTSASGQRLIHSLEVDRPGVERSSSISAVRADPWVPSSNAKVMELGVALASAGR